MWGTQHNIRTEKYKKGSLHYRRYSLLFGTLSISKIDRMILNLRGLFQKRDLAVLQSKLIDDSNGQCRMHKV